MSRIPSPNPHLVQYIKIIIKNYISILLIMYYLGFATPGKNQNRHTNIMRSWGFAPPYIKIRPKWFQGETCGDSGALRSAKNPLINAIWTLTQLKKIKSHIQILWGAGEPTLTYSTKGLAHSHNIRMTPALV